MRTRNWFFIAFLVSIGIEAYNDLKPVSKGGCGDLPWPPRLIYTGLVFVLLDLFSAFNEDLAGVVAIGFVIAQVMGNGFISDCTHPEASAAPGSTGTITLMAANPQPTAFQTMAGGTTQPQ